MRAVYFDTAASPFLYRPEVFSVCFQAGRAEPHPVWDRLSPHRTAKVMDQVQAADLDATARQSILGGNASRLLGLD